MQFRLTDPASMPAQSRSQGWTVSIRDSDIFFLDERSDLRRAPRVGAVAGLAGIPRERRDGIRGSAPAGEPSWERASRAAEGLGAA
jgi:hypothetical protein